MSKLVVSALVTFESELAGGLWLWKLCTNPNPYRVESSRSLQMLRTQTMILANGSTKITRCTHVVTSLLFL